LVARFFIVCSVCAPTSAVCCSIYSIRSVPARATNATTVSSFGSEPFIVEGQRTAAGSEFKRVSSNTKTQSPKSAEVTSNLKFGF